MQAVSELSVLLSTAGGYAPEKIVVDIKEYIGILDK